MSTWRFWIVLAVCVATASVAAAQATIDRAEFLNEVKAMRAALNAKAAPDAPGGSDPDSFGRNVKFDGMTQAGVVALQTDCTPLPGDPPLGPDDRCVTLNPAPASTSFDLPDIGRLTIPGRSAHSLLCHWLTPILYYMFENSTGVLQPNATFRLTPYVVVESEVLNDPTLIDPTTGLPFNGRFETSFAASYRDSMSLEPGHSSTHQFSATRVCIQGFLSKVMLEAYGLTEAQATAVFRHDIVLRFGVRGNAAMLGFGSVIYGFRVVGD